MADSITVTNMPDSGSHEAVAYKLWAMLRPSTDDIDSQLVLYAKCLEATFRNGRYYKVQ